MAIISSNVKPCVAFCPIVKLIHVLVVLERKLIFFHFRENRQISTYIAQKYFRNSNKRLRLRQNSSKFLENQSFRS
jgi:hypothetical protein